MNIIPLPIIYPMKARVSIAAKDVQRYFEIFIFANKFYSILGYLSTLDHKKQEMSFTFFSLWPLLVTFAVLNPVLSIIAT